MDETRAFSVLVMVMMMMISLVVFVDSAGVVAPRALSPAREAEALVAVKSMLHDTANVLTDWKIAAGGGRPCGWGLVICNGDGHVSGLDLRNRSLSGTLSPEIGKLRQLRYLFLQHNAVSGPIPDTISTLKMLQRLDLSYNHFTGHIPGRLGQARDILFVRLNHNNLSGYIPDSLAAAHSIVLLDLSFNNLSSPVPPLSVHHALLNGNPLIQNFSCGELSCSSVINVPAAVPPAVQEEPVTSTKQDPNHKKGLEGPAQSVTLYIATVLLIAFLIAGIVTVVYHWRRRHQIFADFDGPETHLGHLKRFMIKEIQEATNNFDRNNILGQGGFGVVYKGRLRDSTIVAVKRMKDCTTAIADEQFHTEVEVISLIVHRNLLKLTGFCVTNTERLLVYPFMPNGNVSSKLQEYVDGKPALDWSRRRRIALGAARGLVYLHDQCDPKIIHRDIKASNVLLDEYLEAVVADFGLVKLLNHGESHAITVVRGTRGRIPPEYLTANQASEKTDVYAFGFLLIELITGRRSIELHENEYENGGILDWANELLEKNRLSSFVDRRLKNDYVSAELEEMVQIALLCTMYSPDHRPRMTEVVRMLEGSDGSIAEKWEAVKDVDRSKPSTPEFMLSPPVDNGSAEHNSIQLEAEELSGPR